MDIAVFLKEPVDFSGKENGNPWGINKLYDSIT